MSYYFNQMIKFAQKKKDRAGTIAIDLKEINTAITKSRKLDYLTVSYSPPLSSLLHPCCIPPINVNDEVQIGKMEEFDHE